MESRQLRHGYDAYIVACGSDPGLNACRLIVDAPVIGILEAGILMACTLGYKFSIIATVEADVPWMEEKVVHYGLRERFASARAVNISAYNLKDRSEVMGRVAEVAQEVVENDKAEVIVLPGSVMVGMEFELPQLIGVPVLSGMACAFKMAEALISFGQKTSRARKYRKLEKDNLVIGYEDFKDIYLKAER